MTKLNQVIAIEKGVKNATLSDVTRAYHELQRTNLFAGQQRTYQPLDEAGEQLPPTSEVVQLVAEDLLSNVSNSLSRLFDVSAERDYTNTVAKASVVIDGVVLVKDAPVPYLLFLEKQLKDVAAFIKKLPTLDPTKVWSYDPAQGFHVTDAIKTSRSKKVPKSMVMAQATDKHPAQVQPYTDDVVVGNWTAVYHSGAMSRARVAQLLEKVKTLTEAVKFAREAANVTEVVGPRDVGKKVFDYLLG